MRRQRLSKAVELRLLRVRTALLAMLLLDLAAAATWFAGRYGPAQADAQRLFLLWALPGLVYLCGLLTQEKARPRQGPGQAPPRLRLPGIPLAALPPAKPVLPLPAARPTAPPEEVAQVKSATSPWSKVLLWMAIAWAIELAPLAVGFTAGWLTFTFADARPAAAQLATALWALPLLAMVAVRFTERTLRGQLFRGLTESWGAPGAWALTVLCGTALALPAIAPGFAFGAPLVVAAGLATALGREIGATVLYRASGLMAAGIFRGTLVFFDFFLIADWLQPVFVSADYSTGAGTYQLLRAAAPLLAALLLARALRLARPLPPPPTPRAEPETARPLL
jgi:hypothetical protein